MDILIKISQLLLSLTILVVIHECGHFFPARWFKTRVEKFYLFFNPWFSVFKKKIGETEYGLGWLPLGGYVKIAGMVDESFDLEQLKSEPQQWEFRSKPAWQRLIIMVGGVTVNFIFGFLIFAILIWKDGVQYIPNKELKYGIAVDSLAFNMGFRDGDQILKIGTVAFDRFDRGTLLKTLIFEESHKVEVLRDGQNQIISVDPKYISLLTKPDFKNLELWSIRLPAQVALVADGSPAQQQGILAGDEIISVNNEESRFIQDINKRIKGKINTNFDIQLKRGNDTLAINITTNEKGMLGVQWESMDKFLKVETENYGFLAAIPAGVNKGVDILTTQLKAFKQMFD